MNKTIVGTRRTFFLNDAGAFIGPNILMMNTKVNGIILKIKDKLQSSSKKFYIFVNISKI